MNAVPPETSAQDRLDEVLLAYLEAVDAGREPDRDALIGRYPDLAGAPREFFSEEDSGDRLLRPIRDALMPQAPPDFPGYEQLQVISQGGQGTVYRAWQPRMEREVAIKVVRCGGL